MLQISLTVPYLLHVTHPSLVWKTSQFFRGDWTESNGAAKEEKQFLTLQVLTFRFVHKRSGNKITLDAMGYLEEICHKKESFIC